MLYFYVFLVSMFTSIVLIPPISRLAVRMGVLDKSNERKIHEGDIARLGGIAIFFGFLLAALIFFDFNQQMRGFLVGGVVIFLTGLADDLVGLTPKRKLLGQFVAALAVVVMGNISISSVGNLVGSGEIALGWVGIPFTIFCVVGVMNAINLIDGLDGLAAGVTAIASLAFACLAYLTDNSFVFFLSAALGGGILGFLKYNTHPATIFMGDAGSLFLGYCMATASVAIVNGSGGHVSSVTPLVVLAIPIVDTIYVMVRRKMCGHGLFAADRTHIHHRVCDLGFSHGATVNIVYGMAYLVAIVAVLARNLEEYQILIILFGMLALFSVIQKFGLPLLISRNAAEKDVPRKTAKGLCSRRRVTFAVFLRITIKYLLLLTLISSLAVSNKVTMESATVAVALLVLICVLIFMTQDWGNVFLRFVLYFAAAFLCFYTENGFDDQYFFDMPVKAISDGLFVILLAVILTKVALRKRSRGIINSPLESLALFPVVSIPLLPAPLVTEFHLFGLGAKAVTIFIGYKIILMRESARNKKLIFATIVALGAIVIRGAIMKFHI